MRRRGAIFLRVDTSPPIRLTSIVGKIDLPQDLVETDPVAANRVYTGWGLTGIPLVQQLINGLSERVDFQLAGVPATVSYLAELEAGDVRGAPVSLGIARLDEAWQLDGSVRWLWPGIADVVVVSRTTDTNGDVTRSITLSVSTAYAARKRAQFETYTPTNQRRRSPTDSGCDNVPRYAQGSTKKWA